MEQQRTRKPKRFYTDDMRRKIAKEYRATKHGRKEQVAIKYDVHATAIAAWIRNGILDRESNGAAPKANGHATGHSNGANGVRRKLGAVILESYAEGRISESDALVMLAEIRGAQ